MFHLRSCTIIEFKNLDPGNACHFNTYLIPYSKIHFAVLFPPIYLVSFGFSRPSFLILCPRNSNCRFLILNQSHLFVCIFFKISSFLINKIWNTDTFWAPRKWCFAGGYFDSHRPPKTKKGILPRDCLILFDRLPRHWHIQFHSVFI